MENAVAICTIRGVDEARWSARQSEYLCMRVKFLARALRSSGVHHDLKLKYPTSLAVRASALGAFNGAFHKLPGSWLGFARSASRAISVSVVSERSCSALRMLYASKGNPAGSEFLLGSAPALQRTLTISGEFCSTAKNRIGNTSADVHLIRVELSCDLTLAGSKLFKYLSIDAAPA